MQPNLPKAPLAGAAYPLGATTDTDPVWIATGSFDATNNPTIDLAVANKGSNTVSILLGQEDSTSTATGTFVAGTDIPTGKAPVCVVAADFHDIAATGFLDLAVANQTDDTITIYQGNGDGTFKPPTLVQLPSGFAPTSLATGHFTNSGHTDLVVTEEATVSNNAGIVQILLGHARIATTAIYTHLTTPTLTSLQGLLDRLMAGL